MKVSGIALCAEPSCGKMTRPLKAPLTEFPGTVARGGYGKCVVCYRASCRAEVSAQQKIRHDSNVAGLEAYMAGRRRRGVPAEGIRFEYELEDAA
jgi:hypothetical protein